MQLVRLLCQRRRQALLIFACSLPFYAFSRKVLDREQAAIEENRSWGLVIGYRCSGSCVLSIMTQAISLLLNPGKKEGSHRFADSTVLDGFCWFVYRKTSCARKATRQGLSFVSKFILCGHVFVRFHSKDLH